MPDVAVPFTTTLQRARKARRISQLELALELGVSQRHVSFVESGRSRPSRQLLLGWLQALDTPMAVSNEALLLAGYAPAYSAAHLGDPGLAEAEQALGHLLAAHEPAPALVLDAEWNLLRMNKGATWLARTLLPAAAGAIDAVQVNMLDLLTHPEGLGRHVTNLPDVGPRFLARLRRESAACPSMVPRVAAFERMLVSRIGHAAVSETLSRPAGPLLTTRFSSPYGELGFFSMFTTFGTPNDITLASLRVEHMFPADESTRLVLRTHAG
jgi:transcriptional regulator with XRE-family HTH domain